MIVFSLESHVALIPHIHFIHVFGLRVLVMRPVDSTYAVRRYVGAVGLIPADYVAVLFGELPQI